MRSPCPPPGFAAPLPRTRKVLPLRVPAGTFSLTGPFNVGTGKESSVLDLVEVLGKLGREMGIISPDDSFEPQFAPARAGEVQRSALDTRKSRETLGFEARVQLEDGMRRTLEWVMAEDAEAKVRAGAS